MVNDQVFVRGEWIEFNSIVLNDLLNYPEHNDDDYEKLLKDAIQIERSWRKGYVNLGKKFHWRKMARITGT